MTASSLNSAPHRSSALHQLSDTNDTPIYIPHCHFCGSRSLSRWFKYPDQLGTLVDIVTCQVCNSQQPDYGPEPTDRQSKLELQSKRHAEAWSTFTNEEALELANGCASVVDYYRPRLDAIPGDGIIAEIGAGRGGLIQAFKLGGYNIIGCEPTAHLADLARIAYGFDHETIATADAIDFLKDLSDRQISVKAVFMWHVLEHLDEPLDLLRQIAALIVPGGYYIAQVPLLCEEQIHPAHLSFLNETSVQFAADQCGLELAETNFDASRKFMALVLRKKSPAFSWNEERSTRTQNAHSVETRLTEARAQTRQVPHDPQKWDILGELAWQADRYEEAHNAFLNLSRLLPDDVNALVKLGITQRLINKLEQSAQTLTHAMKVAPENASVPLELGITRMMQQLFREAARLFDIAQNLSPENTQSLLLGARCCFELGDLLSAGRLYEQVLELDPVNEDARENLSFILVEIERRAAAGPAPRI